MLFNETNLISSLNNNHKQVELHLLTNVTIGVEVITCLCVIIISLPQLFKVLHDKRTGNISFISFWFYHIGIFL